VRSEHSTNKERRLKRIALTLTLVLGLTGPAWAESWVLWTRLASEHDKYASPKQIGAHDSKATCLDAAKDAAIAEPRQYWNDLGKHDRITQVSFNGDQVAQLGNGQGYEVTSRITLRNPRNKRSMDVTMHSYSECWPVGITPNREVPRR
jgi:hypothetical protein